MKNVDSRLTALETSIDTLRKLKYIKNALDVKDRNTSEVTDLKRACHISKLPYAPIEHELNRLAFNYRFNVSMRVFYKDEKALSFPHANVNLAAEVNGAYIEMNEIKPALAKCGYKLCHNKSNKTYWLYDLEQKKALKTYDEYVDSLYLEKTIHKYASKFEKNLKKICNITYNDTYVIRNAYILRDTTKKKPKKYTIKDNKITLE